MASNEYSGIPKVCRLRTTDPSGPIVDLLNSSGVFIREPGWMPRTAELKSGGVTIESQSADGLNLVAGGYGAVEESIPISANPEQLAARVETLQHYLWQAEKYWIDRGPGVAYIETQLTEDAGLRRARIINGSFQTGTFAFGDRSGLPDNTLTIRREPFWHANVPGVMTGPFENMAKNPSFERWTYGGIEDAVPNGWDETAQASFPATRTMRREERQVAGDSYALDMQFTGAGAAANNRWYLSQRVKLYASATHTIRFWLRVEHGGGGETFSVRITDSTGAVVYLNETYNASRTGGFVHAAFDTDRLAYPYCNLEIGWTATGTAVGSRAVIDRISLLSGTWTAETWPGDFYMDTSAIWSAWDPEDYSFTPGQAYPVDMHNWLDVHNVPGDVEADTRFVLAHIKADPTAAVSPYYGIKKLVMGLKAVEPSPEVLRDPSGYLSAGTQYIGGDRVNWNISSDDWETVYTFQVNGPEITKNLLDLFRVWIRADADDPYPDPDRTFQWRLKSWIGDPSTEITYDAVDMTSERLNYYYHMLGLNPTAYVDWRLPPDYAPPASLGMEIQVKYPDYDEDTYTVHLDGLFLCPAEHIVLAELDPKLLYAQGFILDTIDSQRPVTVGYAINTDIDPRNVRRYFTASRVYDSKLFIGATNVLGGNCTLYGYNPDTEWDTSFAPYASADSFPITDFEIFDGFLYWVTTAGTIFHYYPGRASPFSIDRTIGGTPNLWYIQAFGGYLYICAGDGWVYRWTGSAASAPAQVYDMLTAQSADPLCASPYKHQLFVGGENGKIAVYTTAAGWATGTAVPDGNDVLWLEPFHDRLYALTDAGNVYYWDGDTWTLSRTGNVAVDGYAHKMIVFNDRLYVLLGNNTTYQSINLYSTADGIIWTHDMGIQLAAADSPDYGTLDAYCGRVFVATAAYQTNEYNFGWHAPVLAKIRPPNYNGGEFRLVPKALNRIYAIWSVYQPDAAAGNWRFLREQEFHAKAKLWIDPRWRFLREE